MPVSLLFARSQWKLFRPMYVYLRPTIIKKATLDTGQQGCTPRPAKRRLCPAVWKLPKVDFNPLKLGRIQFCPINICLTHKSVDLSTFLPRHAPPRPFSLAPPCPADFQRHCGYRRYYQVLCTGGGLLSLVHLPPLIHDTLMTGMFIVAPLAPTGQHSQLFAKLFFNS